MVSLTILPPLRPPKSKLSLIKESLKAEEQKATKLKVSGSHYSVITVTIEVFKRLVRVNHKGMLLKIMKRKMLKIALAKYKAYLRFKLR